MKPLFILILLSHLILGRVSGDTISNWQIYKDDELILAGNEGMKKAMLPLTKVNIAENFENLKINFYYDFYSGDIERKISFTMRISSLVNSQTKIRPTNL